MPGQPINVVLREDDLGRLRIAVFFRGLLFLPHLVWLLLWTVAAVLAAIASWVAALVLGRPPSALHRFLAAYVRYTIHVNAYLFLAADPYPGFVGRAGSYPVDVEIGPPATQHRLVTAFRLVLAVPALLLAFAMFGLGGNLGPGRTVGYYSWYGGGAVTVVSFLAWWACLIRGRMPEGFRNLTVYLLGYGAQLDGYLLLLTDRYPYASPLPAGVGPSVAGHPIGLVADDDARRSRLTVFFRFLLAVPHVVWLTLWGLASALAAIASWFATLARGRSPAALHRFLAAYLRYSTHVGAFVYLVANPFPGFSGREGSYPVDARIAGPERQSRWVTGFRLVLAVPALAVAGALGGLLYGVAFLGWFAALVTGRMPLGLQRLGAYALRYSAQTYAYLYLLTDRYPFSGPWKAEPA